ncbi:MAG: hypothetical protein WC470_00390 [Candidatus Paceibacterota bacterium]
MKKFFNLTNIFLLVLFGILAYVLRPILVNSVLIGWDLPAHYYLVTQMLDYLQHFKISGYNIYGFAGYPLFTFYNPLPYIAVCLVHLLSFKFIPIYLSLNIVLFALPFIYLISINYASKAFFDNEKINLAAILFGFLTLFLLGNYGLGLASEISVGLFTNAFAWPFFVFLLGNLERLRQTKNKKYLIWSIVCLSGLVLSHIFTAIFAAFVLLVYFIFYFKQIWKQALILGAASVILTAFWWLPFVLNMGYVSADPIFTTDGMDPIFGIFPKFLFGILLLIFSCIGLVRLIREKKYFLPLIFIISFIFLPRDILKHLINLPVHYYRFTADIALLNVFISAYGFYWLINWISQWGLWKKGNLFSRIPWVAGLVLYLVYLMISINLSFFNVENFQKPLSPASEYFAEDTADIGKLANYIKDNNLQGRILSDTNSDALLTKHYFDFVLPTNNILNMRGLLYDSSLSGKYLYSVTADLFDYANFKSIVFINDKNNKNSQTIETIIGGHVKKTEKALSEVSILGVKYLIVDNKKPNGSPILDFVNSKYNNNLVNVKTTIGRFTLIEIKKSSPLIGKTNYQPFLFVESAGIVKKLKFGDLALQWYKNDIAIDYPVIFANKPMEKISDYDKSQIGGYLVSYLNKEEKCPSQSQMDYWVKTNKPVIFLDSNADCQKPNDSIYFVKSDDKIPDLSYARDIIAKLSQEKLNLQEVKPELVENEKIKFNNNSGTLVNFSYFPKWQSQDKTQTVFWITPSMMFVFARGETELNYK